MSLVKDPVTHKFYFEGFDRKEAKVMIEFLLSEKERHLDDVADIDKIVKRLRDTWHLYEI